MFAPKNSTDISKKNVETFIGPSVKVEGDFTGEGDLVIEGMVIGNLSTNNNLRIGPDAIVEAEVKAKNAYIAGRVKGNVSIKGKLELTGSGMILGNVKALELSVESGGIINGQLTMHVAQEKESVSKEKESAKGDLLKENQTQA
jgi:cytoskeletal protein CcmA (bactofilin family)